MLLAADQPQSNQLRRLGILGIMWRLAPANALPLEHPAAGAIALLPAPAATPIADLDMGASARALDVTIPLEPAIATVTAATISNGQTTITPTLTQVDAIVHAGQTYTLADDPDNPQASEFVENADGTIAIASALAVSTDLPIVAIGGSERIPTNLIDGRVLAPLAGLPVLGQIRWSESLEQQPSGSLNLVCTAETIASVEQRFANGTELELFDRGWSVSSLTTTFKADEGLYLVAVSLTGRWAATRYQQPVKLRSGSSSGSSISPIEPDPDCSNGNSPTAGSTTGRLTVATIAARVGVPFRCEGDFWGVNVPADTPLDATVSWGELANARSRINNCWIDYSQFDAVIARSIERGAIWRYRVRDLQTTYQGDARNSPDYRGYAVEYTNARLSYQTPRASLSGRRWNRPNSPDKPLWVPRPRVRRTLRSGDDDAAEMPAQTDWLKTLDLNWDASGPTKTLKISTTEDGMPFTDEELIYGFCYTAKEIANADGELKGNPAGFWRLVSYKVVTYLYEPVYGYAMGFDTTGWSMRRFKQESEALETIAYGDGSPESAPYLALYQFQKLPLRERSRVTLEAFSNVYNDVDESEAMISYKVCNNDGTSGLAWVKDPTYAPAMFVIEEFTYKNSFASIANPDDDPSSPEGRLCPFTTGEESKVHTYLTIVPSKQTITKSDGIPFTFTNNAEEEIDRFVEWHIEDSAQGAGFKEKAGA
jgi:hypothetical protein